MFVDCPPSLGLLTVNGMVAASQLLVPIQCEFYALQGLSHLSYTIDLIRRQSNPELELAGIVMTLYDNRTTLSAQVVEEVRRRYPEVIFQTLIPRNVRLSEAPSYGLPISRYDPASKGGLAYAELSREVLRRSEGSRSPGRPARQGGGGWLSPVQPRRGLDALIPGRGPSASPPGVARIAPVESGQLENQPRRRFDEAELSALAESLREHGMLQPLVVVRDGGGYRLVAGERRLRAAILAGLPDVPVVMRDTPEGHESLALSLVENVQRHDLNALEEAEAFSRLVEEFGLTREAVAHQVAKTRAYVNNSLRLLGMAPAVQSTLLAGTISAGHARALAALPHPEQEAALRRILREDLNVRQTEALVKDGDQASAARPARAAAQPDPDTRALEKSFREALQAPVSLGRRVAPGHRFASTRGAHDALAPPVRRYHVNPDGETTTCNANMLGFAPWRPARRPLGPTSWACSSVCL